MKNQPWSFHTLLKYTLLQLPALALLFVGLILLTKWIMIPKWIFWGIILLWVLKDLILFHFTWRSYTSFSKENPMINLKGKAEERLDPSGYVSVKGELWKAELMNGGMVEAGEEVIVRKSKGFSLVVEKYEKHQD